VGASWGLFVGILFTVFAALVVVIRGRLAEPAPPLAVLIAMYPLGGVMSGALVGALYPRLTTKARVLAVAPVALFPTVAAVAMLSYGFPTRWDGATWFGAITGSIVLGVFGGLQLWKVTQQGRP
jgi:hypothetical protein